MLIRLYEQGSFPVDKIGKIYPVHNIQEAINDLQSGSVSVPTEPETKGHASDPNDVGDQANIVLERCLMPTSQTAEHVLVGNSLFR